MPQIHINNLCIEYDTFGKTDREPLILIMGLGCQMVAWPNKFLKMLADKGLHVIRFDNRDVGLSSKFENYGVFDIVDLMRAFPCSQTFSAPYTLSDMAEDTVGLMDAIGIEKAHVCGLSMGGMIAQILALEHPHRVASLISLESSTGSPSLPPPTLNAMQAIMTPTPTERSAYIDHMTNVYRVLSGGANRYDESVQRELSRNAFDRSLYPEGFSRQAAAIVASGDRSQKLRSLIHPTLVIHGTLDPVTSIEHGRATADLIPNSRIIEIQGLGHGMAFPPCGKQLLMQSRYIFSRQSCTVKLAA